MIREWILKNMDIHVPPSVMTIFFMLIFVGALYFAFSPRRRDLHAHMAQLPLEEDEGSTQVPVRKENER